MGPEIETFLGPEMATSAASVICAQKSQMLFSSRYGPRNQIPVCRYTNLCLLYFSLMESSCEQVIRVTPSCLLQWGPDTNTTNIPVQKYVNTNVIPAPVNSCVYSTVFTFFIDALWVFKRIHDWTVHGAQTNFDYLTL